MARILWVIMALLACVAPAVAAQPVGPVLRQCTMSWAPLTTNADGTPITDLKEYRIYVSSTPGTQDLTKPQGPPIPAFKTDGTPNTTTTCLAQGLNVNGQYYAVVTALDSAGNQSAKSNEVPFFLDVAGPAAPLYFMVR